MLVIIIGGILMLSAMSYVLIRMHNNFAELQFVQRHDRLTALMANEMAPALHLGDGRIIGKKVKAFVSTAEENLLLLRAYDLEGKKIYEKVITVNKFYLKKMGFKPKICVLGLNPHNYELLSDSEEKRIILPAIKKLIKKGINVKGPVPADTAFINSKSYDILIGMYHDQVLGPYKTIFNFNAINITAGLPYLRVSPDHGTGKDIVKKNLANPLSLIESIKFFKPINV